MILWYLLYRDFTRLWTKRFYQVCVDCEVRIHFRWFWILRFLFCYLVTFVFPTSSRPYTQMGAYSAVSRGAFPLVKWVWSDCLKSGNYIWSVCSLKSGVLIPRKLLIEGHEHGLRSIELVDRGFFFYDISLKETLSNYVWIKLSEDS